MSTHGTGLINIMFSIPHSSVIECFAPYGFDKWYINTASLSNIHYILLSSFFRKGQLNDFYKEVDNAYSSGNFPAYDRKCRDHLVTPPVMSVYYAVADAIEYTNRWRFVYRTTHKWSPIFF